MKKNHPISFVQWRSKFHVAQTQPQKKDGSKNGLKLVKLVEILFDFARVKKINGCAFSPMETGPCIVNNMTQNNLIEEVEHVLLSLPFVLNDGSFGNLHHCVTTEWKELQTDGKIWWSRVEWIMKN